MAQAYTAPTWTDGSGEGISASNLQAISNALQGIVQGTDKAIHNIAINGSTITFTFVDGTIETAQTVNLKGISSVEKTGTSGRVDTYTITFTDGTTSTFTVTNGEQGYDDLAYHVDADFITDVGNNDRIPIYSTIQSTSGEKQITISDLKRNIVTPVVSGKADLTLIAPIQTTLTASKAYAVGEQFVYNQVLYKVTQAIASGAQITIGTNCELADCVTEQLKASLFPLISEMTTPSIVNNNRVRDVVGGYKQIGKTVYVDISCSVNTTMDNTSMVFPMINGWGILYNLPVPAHEVEFACNYMKAKTEGHDRMYASAAILNNGYLYLDFAGFSAVSGDLIHIRGTYEAN